MNLYSGKVLYSIFYLLLIMPVVSFFYTLAVFVSFKYTQDVDRKTVVKGEKVNFFFGIINENIFMYPYVKTNFFGTDTIFADQFTSKCFSLNPYKKVSFSVQLQCRYRGLYHIGIKAFEFEDILGLFKMKYVINEDKLITVYPRIIQLDRFFLKSNYISEISNPLNKGSEDRASVTDYRKYRSGDSYKSIHWKLTARMNELYVKNYNSTSEMNATIFLDLMKLELSTENRAIIEDMLIECTVSIINYCLSNWIPINFAYLKSEALKPETDQAELINIPAKNPLDFEYIYNILSKITFSGGEHLKDVLDVFLFENYKKSNVILITANLNYDLFNQIHKLQLSGHELSLIYISPERLVGKDSEVDAILSFLPEIGVLTYTINVNDDIKEKLER